MDVYRQTTDGYYQNDGKYKCCCGSCHVVTGTKVIAIIEAICLVSTMIGFIIQGDTTVDAAAVVNTIISGLILFCLFWGLKHQNHNYILPHLVGQGLMLATLAIFAVVLIVSLAVGGGMITHFISQESTTMDGLSNEDASKVVATTFVVVGVVALVFIALVAGFEIWFFVVVLKCYRYFKEQQYQKAFVANAPNVEFGAGLRNPHYDM